MSVSPHRACWYSPAICRGALVFLPRPTVSESHKPWGVKRRGSEQSLKYSTRCRMEAFLWCADLGLVGKLPLGPLGWWTISKHRSHRVMRRTTPVELDCTNRGNLSIGKISILSFEIDDQLAHGNRKRAVVIFSLRFGWSKEANDTMCIKGISSTTETSFSRPVSRARSTGGIPKSTIAPNLDR